MYEHLLETAREWLGQVRAGTGSGALDDIRLRRATSNTYYALFHAIAQMAADLFAVSGGQEWSRVYRALDHAKCKQACAQILNQKGWSVGINYVADNFQFLQEARHRADYDPKLQPDILSVASHIQAAEQAIAGLASADEAERRAFLLCLLFTARR